ncbi:MAG TPA: WXG100 family type VII secretion target [Pilimelia sp.]|nr:WXG100 family type VII secretion target [Pilimelia sp.]
MTDAVANPLVAERVDSTRWYTGLGLVEGVAETVAGIESGSWIDGSIGGVATGLDALATVLDPVGSVVSWGVGWLLEHVKPLSDALDWLAGDPDQISAFAQTWRNVAANCSAVAGDLQAAVSAEVAGWGGGSGAAYRAHAAEQLRAVEAVGRAAGGVGALVEGAGLLVALVRELVRDLIADFVSVLAVRLPMWLAETGLTLGVATPWVASQVASLVAKWVARIGELLAALIRSLRRLAPMLTRLSGLIEELQALLRRLARSEPTGPDGEGGKPAPKPQGDTPTEPGGGGPEPPEGPRAPAFEDAEVDSRKISEYAMNPEHPVGRNKYRVINSATGLRPEDAALVERQISEAIPGGTPIRGRADEYGQRWSVDVDLTGPSGTITVRTGWIVEEGSAVPRMTTISFPPKKG